MCFDMAVKFVFVVREMLHCALCFVVGCLSNSEFRKSEHWYIYYYNLFTTVHIEVT